jgi:hypothetical protein
MSELKTVKFACFPSRLLAFPATRSLSHSVPERLTRQIGSHCEDSPGQREKSGTGS